MMTHKSLMICSHLSFWPYFYCALGTLVSLLYHKHLKRILTPRPLQFARPFTWNDLPLNLSLPPSLHSDLWLNITTSKKPSLIIVLITTFFYYALSLSPHFFLSSCLYHYLKLCIYLVAFLISPFSVIEVHGDRNFVLFSPIFPCA